MGSCVLFWLCLRSSLVAIPTSGDDVLNMWRPVIPSTAGPKDSISSKCQLCGNWETCSRANNFPGEFCPSYCFLNAQDVTTAWTPNMSRSLSLTNIAHLSMNILWGHILLLTLSMEERTFKFGACQPFITTGSESLSTQRHPVTCPGSPLVGMKGWSNCVPWQLKPGFPGWRFSSTLSQICQQQAPAPCPKGPLCAEAGVVADHWCVSFCHPWATALLSTQA